MTKQPLNIFLTKPSGNYAQLNVKEVISVSNCMCPDVNQRQGNATIKLQND